MRAATVIALLTFGAIIAARPTFGAEPEFGRQLGGLKLSLSAAASNRAGIQVTIENLGREQRLLGLGWLEYGTVSPEYLQVSVDDGRSFSVAKPTTSPNRPDPIAIPLPPGGRYEFTLSFDDYQAFSGDRRVLLSQYVSDHRGTGGIQVQLKLRAPYCKDAAPAPEARGCWKGTLVSNDLPFREFAGL
jgi:hypothetical protein